MSCSANFRRPFFLIFFVLFFVTAVAAQTPAPTPSADIEELTRAILAGKTNSERDELIAANKTRLSAELGANLIQHGRKSLQADDFAKAESAFSAALKVSETIDNQPGIALALRNLGSVNGIRGNFPQALIYVERAFGIYQTLGDDAGTARALVTIGYAQSSLGNYAASIEATKKSLRLYEKLGDKIGMSNAVSSLNNAYQNIGDFDRAVEYGEKSVALARESGDKQAIGMSLSNLAAVSSSRGDWRDALQKYEESLQMFEQTGYTEHIAAALNNIGGVYSAQGDDASAENYFERGLALREKIGDQDGIALSSVRLGNLKSRQNDFPAALRFLNRSLALRETEAKEPSRLAETVREIGDVYFKTNDLTKAREFYERGLQTSEAIGEKEGIAAVLVRLATLHLAANEREKAQAEAARAIEIAAPLNLREILREALTLNGEIYFAANDKTRARENFEAAIKTIEESRFLVAGGERERQRFFENKLKPYHRIIELLINERKFAEAFAFAERAKARVLLDVLQTGRTALGKAMTDGEKAQEQKLRSDIFGLNSQLQTEAAKPAPDAARIVLLRTKIKAGRNALEIFTTALYAAHPELKLQRGETRISDLNDLKSLVPNEGTALIEYLVTENRTFAFVVAGDKAKINLQVFTLEIKQIEIAAAIENFRGQLARRDLAFAENAAKLYKMLLAPFQSSLKNRSRIIISPDNALWELPFQALVGTNNKYLVETAAVSYAPSLSVLSEIERKRKAAPAQSADLLAFGNPAHDRVMISNSKNPVLQSEVFVNLPEAERQVRVLAALYKTPRRSLVLTGAGATEAEFKLKAADYKILHLATHGVLDDASPLYSYVLLSRGKPEDGQDGRLEAGELMRMDLTANLVVLSACETARGHVGSGEGLVGLSWAFFVAGSPTTAASLWKVESASTTDLMLEFYRRLQSGSAKAEALRQSSLALLKTEKYAHPFYWAGFVIIGDGN